MLGGYTGNILLALVGPALAAALGWRMAFIVFAAMGVGSVFMQHYFEALYYIPVEVVGRRATGTVIGFSNMVANLGGLVISFALGMVKDATGTFQAGFLGIGGLCIFAPVLSIALRYVCKEALRRHALKC